MVGTAMTRISFQSTAAASSPPPPSAASLSATLSRRGWAAPPFASGDRTGSDEPYPGDSTADGMPLGPRLGERAAPPFFLHRSQMSDPKWSTAHEPMPTNMIMVSIHGTMKGLQWWF